MKQFHAAPLYFTLLLLLLGHFAHGQQKKMGPEGGSLSSEDGRLQIIIPAGALKESQEIGIQPISNANPAGNGLAYRLSPHGKKFAKPVTIRISYQRNDGSTGHPDLQGIAYQSEDGVWMSVGGGRMDTLKKTISIETTHFSDWSQFESMRLEPANPIVGVGETAQLKLIQYLRPEDLLPLTAKAGKETPFGIPYLMDPQAVKGWQLSGPGGITQSGNRCAYKAPATIKGRKATAAVSVELKASVRKLLLITNITVVNEGISFRIDQGDWLHFGKEICDYNDDPEYVFATDKSGRNVSISWELKQNNFQFWNTTVEGTTTNFAYHLPGHSINYYSVNTNGPQENEVASPGFISLAFFNNPENNYVSGEFKVLRAGMFDVNHKKISDHVIEGFFFVKKKLNLGL